MRRFLLALALAAPPKLFRATVRKDEPAVHELLESKADPNRANAEKEPPLITSARTNAADEIVPLLLAAGADQGQLKVVKYLLSVGANPDTVDDFGKRAIDYARENGHRDVVRLLSQ